MNRRDCCSQDCQQGRTCHQRIPTVRPLRSKAAELLEEYGWVVILIIAGLVILANLN